MALPPARFTSTSPDATLAHAGAMAAGFPHALILLTGGMGAGKTLWAKGFATGLGCPEHVTSPTFAVMNIYEAPGGPIHHLDLYRVGCLEELIDIGLFEVLERRFPCVIEWSERVPALAELPHIAVHLALPALDRPDERLITWEERNPAL